MAAPYNISVTKPAKHPHRSFLDELNAVTQRDDNTNSRSQIGSSSDFRIPNESTNRHNFTQPSVARVLPQHHHHLPLQASARTNLQPALRHQTQPKAPKNAVMDILPYCTTEPPLRKEQIIALSDVAGSMNELVLLAVGAAAGDSACADKLQGAVGAQTAGCIVEFFVGEWEVE
jgi:hypothetical protein